MGLTYCISLHVVRHVPSRDVIAWTVCCCDGRDEHREICVLHRQRSQTRFNPVIASLGWHIKACGSGSQPRAQEPLRCSDQPPQQSLGSRNSEGLGKSRSAPYRSPVGLLPVVSDWPIRRRMAAARGASSFRTAQTRTSARRASSCRCSREIMLVLPRVHHCKSYA